jgi:hypothetical protein
MNTLKLIVEREYANRVRKKSFILMTILMPFLFVALALLPMWACKSEGFGNEKNRCGGFIPASMPRNSNRTKNTILSSFTKMTHQASYDNLATSFLPYSPLRMT